MKTSVIIPIYNNQDLVEETLETIYRQTLPDVEIVVVDDGSTDDTPAVLARHADRLVTARQPNSGGCSKPRNTAMPLAGGEIFAIFDSDDLMAPDKLERQVGFLERHPDVDFVFTDFVDFEGDRDLPPHTHSCVQFRAALDTCRTGEDEYVLPSGTAYPLLLDENFIGASTMVFRRTLVDRVGGFNEEFNSSEDREFTLRVTRENPVGFVDMLGHRRRLHDGSMSANTEKVLRAKIRLFNQELGVVPAEYRGKVTGRLATLNAYLGWFLRGQGRYREAGQFYRRALALRPARLRIYGSYARNVLRSLTAGGG